MFCYRNILMTTRVEYEKEACQRRRCYCMNLNFFFVSRFTFSWILHECKITMFKYFSVLFSTLRQWRFSLSLCRFVAIKFPKGEIAFKLPFCPPFRIRIHFCFSPCSIHVCVCLWGRDRKMRRGESLAEGDFAKGRKTVVRRQFLEVGEAIRSTRFYNFLFIYFFFFDKGLN